MRTRARTHLLVALALAFSVAPGCRAYQRRKPPPIPARIDVALGSVQSTRLEDGPDVLLVRVPGSGTVRLELLLRGGTTTDPRGRSGLVRLLARALLEGSGGGDRQALLDRFGDLGADPAVEVTAATLGVRVAVAQKDALAAATLLGEMLGRPTLDPDAFARVRDDSIDTLRLIADEPEALASLALAQAVMRRPHATEIDGLGTITSLAALDVASVQDHLRALRRPGNAALVVVGDLGLEDARRLATAAIAGWDPPPDADPPAPRTSRAPAPGREIVLVPVPGLAQSIVAIGGELLPRDHPEEPGQSIARDLMAGLVQLELRGQRQLSYGAVPVTYTAPDGGMYGVHAKVAASDTRLALAAVMQRFIHTSLVGISDDAILQARQGELVRTMVEQQAFDVVADTLRRAWGHDLGTDVEQVRLERVAALRTIDVDAALRRELDPRGLRIVVVGPPEVEAQLRTLNAGKVRIVDRDALLGLTPGDERRP
jgi:zinc protease